MTELEHGVNGASMPDEDFWRSSVDDGAVLAQPRIKLLFGPELAEELPDLEYLVEQLGLVAGGGAPHLVAGYGWSGKTVAVQALLLALAAGRAVWFAHGVQRRRVLHVDLEQGERLTRRRYQRLARAADIDLCTLGDALAVASMPRLSLAIESYDDWKELMTGRDVAVIDSLRAATGGLDENDSSIRVPIDMLTRLSEETKCRALLIHHGRKPSNDASDSDKFAIRGSGAIFDACDGVYVFVAAKGDPVSVRQVKARTHGEPIEDFALVIEDVAGAGDDFKWGLSVRLHGHELITKVRAERAEREAEKRGTADVRRLEQAMMKHPGAGTTDLRAATRLGGDRFNAAMLALGERVQRVEEREGRARRVRHFLKVQPPAGAPS